MLYPCTKRGKDQPDIAKLQNYTQLLIGIYGMIIVHTKSFNTRRKDNQIVIWKLKQSEIYIS